MNPHFSHIEKTAFRPQVDEERLSGVKVALAPNSLKRLKQGIWLYFFLIIFEGALRKWLLPDLSTPLLIIRDPIAIWLVLSAWKRGLLPSNLYLTGFVTIGILSYITASIFGHGNIYVAVYGARIFLIHIPLIFVIGQVFNKADVEKIGKFILWIAILMAALIAIQFYSPQSAWVNRGVGGDIEGAGFGGALGYFRPPATFSFTNGTSLFFSFVACYVFYFWIKPSGISRFLLFCATVALLIAIPLSISRGLLFQVLLTSLFTILIISRKPEYSGRLVLGGIIAVIAFAALSNTGFFLTATEAFSSRFVEANITEGGLEGVFIDRFLGGMIGALIASTELPFWGHGLGMGTNVGSMLLTGRAQFLIAEGEWARIIGELGPLLGIGVILLRVALITRIGLACYRGLTSGNFLPWLLFSFGLFQIMQGQWAQPTSLGFSTLIAGLMIASLKTPMAHKNVNKQR